MALAESDRALKRFNAHIPGKEISAEFQIVVAIRARQTIGDDNSKPMTGRCLSRPLLCMA
jgi:hypothetical protein